MSVQATIPLRAPTVEPELTHVPLVPVVHAPWSNVLEPAALAAPTGAVALPVTALNLLFPTLASTRIEELIGGPLELGPPLVLGLVVQPGLFLGSNRFRASLATAPTAPLSTSRLLLVEAGLLFPRPRYVLVRTSRRSLND